MCLDPAGLRHPPALLFTPELHNSSSSRSVLAHSEPKRRAHTAARKQSGVTSKKSTNTHTGWAVPFSLVKKETLLRKQGQGFPQLRVRPQSRVSSVDTHAAVWGPYWSILDILPEVRELWCCPAHRPRASSIPVNTMFLWDQPKFLCCWTGTEETSASFRIRSQRTACSKLCAGENKQAVN